MDECCQNGCNNCVLDQQLENKRKPISNTQNLLTNAYLKYELISIQRCTAAIFRLAFKLKTHITENAIIDIPPGWHMQLRAPKVHDREINPLFADFRHPETVNSEPSAPKEQHDTETENCYISRPYTPIFVDQERLGFDILVKLEPNGRMTRYIQTLNVGDIVEWKGPHGSYEIDTKFTGHLLCFCQGVAIAPIFSIAKAILDDGDNETRIHLICCFADLDNCLLRNEIKAMMGYWNFNAATYLAHQRCFCGGCENLACAQRRIFYKEPVMFRRLADKDVEGLVEKLEADRTFILICGSLDFSQLLVASLQRLGFNKYRVL